MNIDNLELADVFKVYEGKRNACMCGCAGKYHVAVAHRAWADKARGYPHDDNEVNDGAVMRVFGTIIEAGMLQDSPTDNYVYAHVGKKIYVAYFIDRAAVGPRRRLPPAQARERHGPDA